MLLGRVRLGRNFRKEFDQMIKLMWYILKAFERMELWSYTHRKAMRHAIP